MKSKSVNYQSGFLLLLLLIFGAFGGFGQRKPVMTAAERLQEAEKYYKIAKACAEKDFDCQIENYTSAIKFNPQYENAYFNRAIAYEEKGNPDLAVKDYTKIIALNAKDADAYNN